MRSKVCAAGTESTLCTYPPGTIRSFVMILSLLSYTVWISKKPLTVLKHILPSRCSWLAASCRMSNGLSLCFPPSKWMCATLSQSFEFTVNNSPFFWDTFLFCQEIISRRHNVEECVSFWCGLLLHVLRFSVVWSIIFVPLEIEAIPGFFQCQNKNTLLTIIGHMHSISKLSLYSPSSILWSLFGFSRHTQFTPKFIYSLIRKSSSVWICLSIQRTLLCAINPHIVIIKLNSIFTSSPS